MPRLNRNLNFYSTSAALTLKKPLLVVLTEFSKFRSAEFAGSSSLRAKQSLLSLKVYLVEVCALCKNVHTVS